MAAEVQCSLCRERIADENHRNKKRLHGLGGAAAKAKATLCEISPIPIHCLEGLQNPRALLCRKCERILIDIPKLEHKVALLKRDVVDKLQRLQFATSHPGESSTLPECSASQFSVPCLAGMSEDISTEPLQHQDTNVEQSPQVEVTIPYKSGSKKFKIRTPSRKKCIKGLSRKSYCSSASALVNSPDILPAIVNKLALKMKTEMRRISSEPCGSLLRDNFMAVKHFHWETVMLELLKEMPTLMSLLAHLIPNPTEHKPMLCLIASQILKARHQHMGLVQRAVSVMMYGNGTAKQVFSNLQPLGVCLSFQRTMGIVKSISEDHDIEVQEWADCLVGTIKPGAECNGDLQPSVLSASKTPDANCGDDESTSEIEESDDDLDDDIAAPQWSPLSSVPSEEEESLGEEIEYNLEEDAENPIHDLLANIEPPLVSQPLQQSHSTMEMDNEEVLPSGKETEWFGFKLFGDNVDQNIQASHLRLWLRNQSLHNFQGCAMRDRVNLSHLSDSPPSAPVPDPELLLPSHSDVLALKKELAILVSRILVHYLVEFKDQASSVPEHIPSRYSAEMASKSDVKPMGVELFNENKLEEMSEILTSYMRLVPAVESRENITLPCGASAEVDTTSFHCILFGGDQLTAARIRGTKELRDTEAKKKDRFEGLVPVVEDWHTRMTLMKVIWQRLNKAASVDERGTMYQLRNLVHRINVPGDPQSNMHASEDFLLLLLHAHVVSAAETLQKQNPAEREVMKLAEAIVDNFVRLPRTYENDTIDPCTDGVHVYAIELITLGLIWHGFHDSTKEGDGDRLQRYWKFLVIIFKSTNHRNYAKEAVNVLFQYYYVLSERQKEQLLWSRCVNTKGIPGGNIPCDLYMEHLNRRLKIVIRGMGANKKPTSIQRAGKSIGIVHNICERFEKQTASRGHSDDHPFPSFGKDFEMILDQLNADEVFSVALNRQHKSFHFRSSLIEKLSRKELAQKVKRNIKQLV